MLIWTVYRYGVLFDLMTDAEVAGLMRVFPEYVVIDLVGLVVEF
jgi:hypothetical protein